MRYAAYSLLTSHVIMALTYGVLGTPRKQATMARAPAYTPEEDAIILQTSGQSAAETNSRLMAGGFKERTADAISGRRYYLRNSPTATEANATVQSLLQRRDALKRVHDETGEALAEVERILRGRLEAELAGLDPD